MTSLIEFTVKLLLDTAILIALVVALGRKRRPDYLKVVLSCLAVVAAYALYDLVPRWLLGYFFVVPLILITGVILVMFGRLSVKQAAMATGVFFLLHATIGWIL